MTGCFSDGPSRAAHPLWARAGLPIGWACRSQAGVAPTPKKERAMSVSTGRSMRWTMTACALMFAAGAALPVSAQAQVRVMATSRGLGDTGGPGQVSKRSVDRFAELLHFSQD